MPKFDSKPLPLLKWSLTLLTLQLPSQWLFRPPTSFTCVTFEGFNTAQEKEEKCDLSFGAVLAVKGICIYDAHAQPLVKHIKHHSPNLTTHKITNLKPFSQSLGPIRRLGWSGRRRRFGPTGGL